MPWTCASCGKFGGREGADPSWCHRAGLATLKGNLQCCNCMLACGWDGYDEYGCMACLRAAKRRLPIGSARREKVDAIVERAFATLHQPAKSTAPKFQNSLQQLPNVKRIAVFEFDDVLFRTPRRPTWWPYHSYHDMIESLLPPAVPRAVDSSWWNDEVVAEAKAACEDPDTWAVLITYRGDGFKQRIRSLLQQQGIRFDETRFRPLSPFLSQLGATYTGAAGYGPLQPNLMSNPQAPQDKHSLVILGEILGRCSRAAAVLDIWAAGHRAGALSQLLRSTHARAVQVHNLQANPHAAGTPTAAALQEMVARKVYEKSFSRKGNVIAPALLFGSTRTGSRQRRVFGRTVMQPVKEHGTEAPDRPKRTACTKVAKLADWPVEIYAGRRTRLGWGYDEIGWKRNNMDFTKLCDRAYDDDDHHHHDYDDEDDEMWSTDDAESDEELQSSTNAFDVDEAGYESESSGWGWGGGIEFEWVDDEADVMSMTNSCAGSELARSEWSEAADDVLSMCSASVVGASDVMSVDSGWAEDEDDWRAALENATEDDVRGVEEAAGGVEEAEQEAEPGEERVLRERPPLSPQSSPYLQAVLRDAASVPHSCGAVRERSCPAAAPRRGLQGKRKAADAEHAAADGGSDAVGEPAFACFGGWKKARSRRGARLRLQRMLDQRRCAACPAVPPQQT